MSGGLFGKKDPRVDPSPLLLDQADLCAKFLEAMNPWVTALAHLRQGAIEQGLTEELADEIVREAMRMAREAR